ncbi:MAG: Crp/Fnr family transcriptional regulator [Cardiobacteriaceae bacterium]|nr:Crp/Fnr family transcriptional regulator [Cardiobacteriaceae bacterium]
MPEIFETHYLLAPLSQADRQKLIHHKHRRHYHAGSLVFTRNQMATDFFLVISGTIRLYFSSPDGKEKTIKLFSCGQSFGEALMFMQRDTYPANAIATEDSELLIINNHEFREILLNNTELCFAIMGTLSEYVQILSSQIEMLSVFDARARLLHYIRTHISGEHKDGKQYPLTINKKDLAEYLAIRAETLSRLLKQLEQEKILTWDQHGITVHDWKSLYIIDC